MSDKYELENVTIRMVTERPLFSSEPMSSPEAAVRVMHNLMKDLDREMFAVINLQADLKPINMNIVSIGALNASIAQPREILKSVVLSNAYSVILIHNHPSGKLKPSPEDINVTGKMMEVLNLLDVELLDHVILGPDDRYYSFREMGTIPLTEKRVWTDEKEIGLKKQRNAVPER